MSYDIVFVASCTLDPKRLAAWKKTKIDPGQWTDWQGSFGNQPEETPTAAVLLGRWKAWGPEDEPEFLSCKVSKGKLTLQGFLAETSYHEVAPLLGAFFRSCAGFGGAGDLYALGDAFRYRLSVRDGASRFNAFAGDLPADVQKTASGVEREAARRIGEEPAEAAAPGPRPKKASLDTDPPESPSVLGEQLDNLVGAGKYQPVEAYAKRYFAAGLPRLKPGGAQTLLECWFRQQKGAGAGPLLAKVLSMTEAAMETKDPKHEWLTNYSMQVSLMWVLGFAGQADRGIEWFERMRGLGCFVSPNALDAYVYLLYTSKTAALEVRVRAMNDLASKLGKEPYFARQMTWAWHNLAALAAVVGDAERVAGFVEQAKAAGYDLGELRKETLLGPFRADPRVKAVLG